MIEQLDDILEELADRIGVYGACQGGDECKRCECRSGWVSEYRQRILRAVEIERRLDHD